jgi:iron(III) transport system permease protein
LRKREAAVSVASVTGKAGFGTAKVSSDAISIRIGIGLLVVWLFVTIALPLWSLLSKSFENSDGQFVGLANFVTYFSTPTLFNSIFNSLWVALLATAIVIPLAFGYAYALTRSCMPVKGLLYAVALLPLFAPSLLSAISLIYLFGNQGILKNLLLGNSIYGPLGIVIAQVFYCFPHALIILVTALALADARLYEVAEALGTRTSRIFRTVTLPGAKYGLVNAAFVVFTLVITDFGIAKVIGGQFNVLATDAYKQVVGQQNFSMGAVVGMILLVPAILAFLIDRLVQRRQVALLSARAVPLQPKPSPLRDWMWTLYAGVLAVLIVGVLGTAAWASFITYWPYNLSLTLKNYDFGTFDAHAWAPYFNSLKMAALAAIIGTAIVFTGAYLIEKTKVASVERSIAHLLAMLPVAVPGLVLGLGYVFFVNAPWNPLNIFYGTMIVLVVNCIAHFYTVAHITALTALKQIDPEFESVSESLKVSIWRTFRRVTVPICMPAILDIAIYMFVNALTTVSAVIFLYAPDTKPASVAIVHMDEAGVTAGAAAMATLILLTALGVKLLHLALNRFVFVRAQAWRNR